MRVNWTPSPPGSPTMWAYRLRTRQSTRRRESSFAGRWSWHRASFSPMCSTWTYLDAGKFNDGIAELKRAEAMDSPPFVAAWLGYAYAKSGDRDKARAILAELNQMSSQRFVSPFCTAIIYLGLGDLAQALDGSDKSYDARSWWLLFLKVD